MFENWTPKDEDYTSGITTDKWVEILSNEEINGLFQTEKKGDRWWPIMFYCRTSKESEKGSYMFKFRPEFKDALKQINISKYLKNENIFTWIPFYKDRDSKSKFYKEFYRICIPLPKVIV